ncbi:hypothetical protein [Lutibacter sp.]|uniref:hypothetical protein n=1 Tax=Lutibacter sp. TaxID=1925666 RepID=UPI00356B54B0
MDKYAYISIYALTLAVGLYSFKKYNHNLHLKLWLYFLVYSFITEIIGVYLIYFVHLSANILYNTWWLANSIFYMFFFLGKIELPIKKKLLIGLVSIFVIYNIISTLFYRNYQNEIFVDSFILGQLFVVLTIMLYYTELLKSNAILNINQSLFFWISIGALIFNIGMLPVFVIAEFIDWQGIFNYIILGLNIILSLCFITGFIVSKKEYNT